MIFWISVIDPMNCIALPGSQWDCLIIITFQTCRATLRPCAAMRTSSGTCSCFAPAASTDGKPTIQGGATDLFNQNIC